MGLRVSDHAIDRYLQRSGDRKRRRRWVAEKIRRLATDPEAVRMAEGCRSILSSGWVLIQEGSTIVTVYREGEQGLPSPKKKKVRKSARRPRFTDLPEAA